MNVIELNNVRKVFGGRAVLNGITFHVEEGEIFGCLGPNGAGKTTILRIILGLLRPTSGTALVRGSDLGKDDQARQEVGVLLENDGLYERLSAKDNLDYYARIYSVKDKNARIDHLLELMDLDDRRDDRVGTFSKGMRRKLGIARAIIHDPELLLLDEPTSGLDPEAQKMVRETIQELSEREKRTVLFSSHNLDEVQRICSKVAVIKDGELRAFDTIDNLRGSRGMNTVQIHASDILDRDRAIEVLRSLNGVKDIRSDGQSITVQHTYASSFDLLEPLVNAKVRIEELKRASRSLEDVYIDLVREEGAS